MPDPRRWIALALLCVTQFMVILDVAIVNVALPAIQTDLGFSEQGLQWVLSAYTLTFGGFLMLGGRVSDLLGRRRVFMVGIVVFGLASLACGVATSSEVLIGARAVQGLGAAIISPAALSIVTTTFAQGRERNIALGVWGAIAGVGGAVGVLLGGILTDALSWNWIFWINVPIALVVLLLTPRMVRESRVEGMLRHFDALGALTITGGLVVLVFALVKAPDYGWVSPTTLVLLAASLVLLTAFVIIERRSPSPLVPLGIFRNRSLSAANVVAFLLGAAVVSMFFFLSLHMQQVLGYSALKTGIAYLSISVTIVLASGASQTLVTKMGVRPVLIAGMALTAIGIGLFAQISVGGSYVTTLLPGFIVAGVGLGFAFVPVTIAALQGVHPGEAGVASGLINTTQQIGGALGIAVLSTVAFTHQATLVARGIATPEATASGFRWAFWVGAGMAVAGLVAALLFVQGGTPDPTPAPVPIA